MVSSRSLAPEADEDLMRLLKAGRMDALEALYDRHSLSLLGYIARMTGDRDVAHDLLHDVVLAVAKGAASYVYPRPVRPWLFTIARNRTINHIKRAAPTPVSNELLDEQGETYGWFSSPSPSSPDDEAEADERKEILKYAFETLQPAEKEVVFLRLTQGLRFREIADVTGCGADAVRQRMSRAIKKLRKRLPSP